MKKILLSSLILFLLGCVSSVPKSNVPLKSCYYGNKTKKYEADEYMKNFIEIVDKMSASSEMNEKIRYLKSSKENLVKAASIGHPEALAKFCALALDKFAPLQTRRDGIEWCKFGIDTVPGLEVKLPKSLVEKIEKIEYTEITKNRCVM